MSESEETHWVVDKLRTKEPEAPVGEEEPDPNVVSDATHDEKAPGEPVNPGIGGYAGRDPKTEMPMMPSVPETQEEAATHDGAPSTDKPRPVPE
jgi:hypothetical protein